VSAITDFLTVVGIGSARSMIPSGTLEMHLILAALPLVVIALVVWAT
jgi:hypothetical protein